MTRSGSILGVGMALALLVVVPFSLRTRRTVVLVGSTVLAMVMFWLVVPRVAERDDRASGRTSISSSRSPCGAATGFDSGEPFWRSQIVSVTIANTARNSLCQFWNDSNQNWEPLT